MNTSKIIKGVVGGGRYTVTAPIIKEDYGLYLKIEGLELPSTYEVDFSNSEHNGTSVTMIGNADGVLIPSQFIKSGKDVFAFLYHVGDNYGKTVFKFRIPNKLRPDRTDEEPTPEQASTIDQTIAALNTAVAKTAQDVVDADASSQSASADADRAEEARTDAQNFATQAETSADNASASASQASASARASAQSAQTATEKANSILNLTASAQTLHAGSSASASYNAQTGVMTFGIPKGDKGEKGDRGEQGIQGIQGERGLTGAKGDKGDEGDKGDKGDKGATGADGFSPTASVTQTTSGATISITDKNGTTSASISNGTDGQPGGKGDTGERGTGILQVTTAPTSYTTQTGGFTPKFRIALSTVQSQAYVDEVLIGDVISHSYNLYHVGYVDDTYAYLSAATSIRGAKGTTGAQGPAGSDASVTSANIESALGYMPVSRRSVNESLSKLINNNAEKGYVLTYDSTASESKPYPWSWAPAPIGTTIFTLNSNDSAGIYYVISQLKTAADNSGVASTSVPFEAGSVFLSNISDVYVANKAPIFAIQGASPNPIMRYLSINNLWADSTVFSGAEMGYWDGLYHVEIVIGQSTITIIVEKKG